MMAQEGGIVEKNTFDLFFLEDFYLCMYDKHMDIYMKYTCVCI